MRRCDKHGPMPYEGDCPFCKADEEKAAQAAHAARIAETERDEALSELRRCGSPQGSLHTSATEGPKTVPSNPENPMAGLVASEELLTWTEAADGCGDWRATFGASAPVLHFSAWPQREGRWVARVEVPLAPASTVLLVSSGLTLPEAKAACEAWLRDWLGTAGAAAMRSIARERLIVRSPSVGGGEMLEEMKADGVVEDPATALLRHLKHPDCPAPPHDEDLGPEPVPARHVLEGELLRWLRVAGRLASLLEPRFLRTVPEGAEYSDEVLRAWRADTQGDAIVRYARSTAKRAQDWEADAGRWRSEVHRLRKVVCTLRDDVQKWLEHDDCECPAEGHHCGRPKLQRHVNEADQVLAGRRAHVLAHAECRAEKLEFDAAVLRDVGFPVRVARRRDGAAGLLRRGEGHELRSLP